MTMMKVQVINKDKPKKGTKRKSEAAVAKGKKVTALKRGKTTAFAKSAFNVNVKTTEKKTHKLGINAARMFALKSRVATVVRKIGSLQGNLRDKPNSGRTILITSIITL